MTKNPMIKSLLAGLVMLLSSFNFAAADALNGQQLRLYCTSQNPQDDAICIVYITGAVDAFTTIDLMGQKTSGAAPRFCLPDTAGPDQLKDVTLAWLERPETDLEFAATLPSGWRPPILSTYHLPNRNPTALTSGRVMRPLMPGVSIAGARPTSSRHWRCADVAAW